MYSFKKFFFNSFCFVLLVCLCASAFPSCAKITSVTQETILPGLIHHRFIKHVSRGPVIINVLEIDTTKGFKVKPALAQANTIWAKATLPKIVAKEGAIAGINANYFNGRGMPIGSLAIDKEWITGPVFNRASVSIDDNGHLGFARPSVTGKLSVFDGGTTLSPLSASAYFPPKKIAKGTLEISKINQPDTLGGGNGISFYNHWWQDQIACGNGRACLLVDGNGIVRMKILSVESVTPIQPTRTDYVLSSQMNSLFDSVKQGDKVTLSWYSRPDWSSMSHVVGGGPFLLSKGEIIINTELEGFSSKSGIGSVAPRTAIGMTAPGRLIWLVADGRQKNSVGLSLWELAALMKEIGVVEAINMDGGGSTTMVLNGGIVNSPSDPSLRSVSTALLLYKSSFGNSSWKNSVYDDGGP